MSKDELKEAVNNLQNTGILVTENQFVNLLNGTIIIQANWAIKNKTACLKYIKAQTKNETITLNEADEAPSIEEQLKYHLTKAINNKHVPNGMHIQQVNWHIQANEKNQKIERKQYNLTDARKKAIHQIITSLKRSQTGRINFNQMLWSDVAHQVLYVNTPIKMTDPTLFEDFLLHHTHALQFEAYQTLVTNDRVNQLITQLNSYLIIHPIDLTQIGLTINADESNQCVHTEYQKQA